MMHCGFQKTRAFLLLLSLCALGMQSGAAEDKRLFIYNWTDFIGPETVSQI